MLHEAEEIAGIDLAGVLRHAGGQVAVGDQVHAVLQDFAVRLGALDIAAAVDGGVHDDAARLHAAKHDVGYDDGSLPAEDLRGGNDDV